MSQADASVASVAGVVGVASFAHKVALAHEVRGLHIMSIGSREKERMSPRRMLLWCVLYQFGWVYSQCTGKFVECGGSDFVVGVSPNRLYRLIGHIRFS